MSETSADRFGDGFGGERMWGLKELPYPDAVSFAPETVGWLVLALILALAAGWWCWIWYRRRRADAYRRAALARLERLETSHAAELPFLLRKVALTTAERVSPAGRPAVASLRGSEWIRWLNQTAGSILFQDADAEALDRMAYADRPPDAAEFARLKASGCRWIRIHHA